MVSGNTADASKADLFIDSATLRSLVDGDTPVFALAVSPGVFIEQKRRLRGLACPEMSTLNPSPTNPVSEQSFCRALLNANELIFVE